MEMIILEATFDCNVKNITLHYLSQVTTEDHAHCTLVSGTHIF